MLDYNKSLTEVNRKVYRRLLKFEEIKPTDKLQLLFIGKSKQRDCPWELQIRINDDAIVYWRVSHSLYHQIGNFNNENNTDVFYIHSRKKESQATTQYPRWILELSTSPNTIKETKEELMQLTSKQIEIVDKVIEKGQDASPELMKKTLKMVAAQSKKEEVNPGKVLVELKEKSISRQDIVNKLNKTFAVFCSKEMIEEHHIYTFRNSGETRLRGNSDDVQWLFSIANFFISTISATDDIKNEADCWEHFVALIRDYIAYLREYCSDDITDKHNATIAKIQGYMAIVDGVIK